MGGIFMEGIFWLVALAFFIVVEMVTLGLTTIWFAIGCLVAFLASLIGIHLGIQIALCIVVSVVLLIFTRPLATKYLNSQTTKTNAEGLVGKTAEVTIAIDNIKAQGQVMINGMDWTARSTDDEKLIKKDSLVTIIGINGVKLIVEEKETKKDEYVS